MSTAKAKTSSSPTEARKDATLIMVSDGSFRRHSKLQKELHKLIHGKRLQSLGDGAWAVVMIEAGKDGKQKARLTRLTGRKGRNIAKRFAKTAQSIARTKSRSPYERTRAAKSSLREMIPEARIFIGHKARTDSDHMELLGLLKAAKLASASGKTDIYTDKLSFVRTMQTFFGGGRAPLPDRKSPYGRTWRRIAAASKGKDIVWHFVRSGKGLNPLPDALAKLASLDFRREEERKALSKVQRRIDASPPPTEAARQKAPPQPLDEDSKSPDEAEEPAGSTRTWTRRDPDGFSG